MFSHYVLLAGHLRGESDGRISASLPLAQSTKVGSWSIETALRAAQDDENAEVNNGDEKSWNKGRNKTRDGAVVDCCVSWCWLTRRLIGLSLGEVGDHVHGSVHDCGGHDCGGAPSGGLLCCRYIRSLAMALLSTPQGTGDVIIVVRVAVD